MAVPMSTAVVEIELLYLTGGSKSGSEVVLDSEVASTAVGEIELPYLTGGSKSGSEVVLDSEGASPGGHALT